MEIPAHLTCHLRNLYAGQEAKFRTGHGTTDWFQIRKGVRQRCILSPCFLTYMQSTSWEMLYWMKHKLESRLPGEMAISSYMQMTTLITKSEEELKSLLMKVKEESEKVGLKLNIQNTKIMASSPTTSWQIEGETVADFILGGSKITADGDCSHEIKRHLVLGRKAMTNLDSILKSRDITLPTNVHLVKAMVFPVVIWMWQLDWKESWVPRNWCFWTVVLEKTLESPLDCKEIQPVHLKEISPEYSLEGLMLKLKLQYFGLLMQRTESLEKTLMLGKIEGWRRGWQRVRWLDGITDSMDMS